MWVEEDAAPASSVHRERGHASLRTSRAREVGIVNSEFLKHGHGINGNPEVRCEVFAAKRIVEGHLELTA